MVEEIHNILYTINLLAAFLSTDPFSIKGFV